MLAVPEEYQRTADGARAALGDAAAKAAWAAGQDGLPGQIPGQWV
jgi:hypothetical protein